MTSGNNYSNIVTKFSGIRYEGGFLIPESWNLKVEVTASRNCEDPSLTATKILTWYGYLNDILLVPFNDENASGIVYSSSNAMMQMPVETSDDMLSKLIYYKSVALANGNMNIGKVVLKSESNPVEYIYKGYPGKCSIDDVMDEKLHSEHWWNRNDSTTFEYAIPNDQETKDRILNQEDPLSGFDDEIKESIADIIEVSDWPIK